VFVSDALKTHLESSSTVQINSLVLAEWNMNMPDNIQKLGNYRYRPIGSDTKLKTIANTFDILDVGNYYTGATDADISITNGTDDAGQPQIFVSKKEKMKMLYSLEDCIKPFRPRSGINKPLFFRGHFLGNSNQFLAQRPRYYMSSRHDQFRYWTSFRTEVLDGPGGGITVERGIAKNKQGDSFYIDDAAPFVVYKENVPANRIVVKMQTNVGEINLGPFSSSSGVTQDPLYGEENATVPKSWKIEYLSGNNWVTAKTFGPLELRSNGLPIIGSGGYVELKYGITIPEKYKDSFKIIKTVTSKVEIPDEGYPGFSYLLTTSSSDIGKFYVYTGISVVGQDVDKYDVFVPTYGWSLSDESINNQSSFVTDLSSPASFFDPQGNGLNYREFQYIRGIRLVVDTMNKFDSTFDLIEMSPRLAVDLSDKVLDFKINKSLGDLGSNALPVGQLLASTGNISIFDYDQSFNINNSNSIINKYIRKDIKFNFYEKIIDVDGYDYFVPIKTLYSQGFPQIDSKEGTVSVELRDLFFMLESTPAPRLLVTEASLSYAITLLLDYIGFTQYVFLRLPGEKDPVIPYFFVAPDQNVAEVLNKLAVSTQTAMFFDEYNNLVLMSKDYLLPSNNERSVDFVLSGSNNQSDTGVIENQSQGSLPNILAISSEDKQVFNAGKINYTTRYIQRSYGAIRQASLVDNEKTWVYKPSLLWEVSGTENTKTINEIASKQGSYILGAMPINSNIVSLVPKVVSNQLTNNIIDFGENIYWLTRYSGYFYSNGEIIKYDAAEFNVTMAVWYDKKPDGSIDYDKQYFVEPGALAPAQVRSSLEAAVSYKQIPANEAERTLNQWKQKHIQGSSNVWISSNEEYQKYFSSLPFNGKIYPTGRVRIYAVPYYETTDGITKMKNGQVVEHGRGQFGTPVTSHAAGIDPYWSNNDNVRGCTMKSSYLFSTSSNVSLPSTVIGAAGVSNDLAKQTTRNGIIKNFMATNQKTETDVNALASAQTGTIQSSALVMNGRAFKTGETPIDFISYVYKPLDNAYRHFGTRLRVIGKVEASEVRGQTPTGSSSYYQVTGALTSQSVNIGGGGGGIGVMLNPSTNNGYYFEIAALTDSNIESYLKTDGTSNDVVIHNVLFYKIKKDASTNDAIPQKLWGGLTNITVDPGSLTGQYRMTTEENPTVYDLSVEYIDIGKTRRFYLYINNSLISVVDDTDPLPVYNNMALFVRGSSRVMFENIYAIAANYSQNTVALASPAVQNIFGQTSSSNTFNKNTGLFGENQIDINESFRKYAMSGVVQSTYLAGISAQQPPKYNMYFDEFGTIMRECAYFDIKYDRSYPALYAQLSPTFNRIKGYTVSGFYADSYGAEFLIFNSTDKSIVLDDTSGNYLRIQGITFTQNTTHELTVDEYFNKRSSLSDPEMSGTTVLTSPYVETEKFNKIKQSRMIYGTNEFSIDAPYIQTDDFANELMGWIVNKTMDPKQSVGVNIFAIPTLQLGDIVALNYKNAENIDIVASPNKKFIVYNIEYSRSVDGPSMSVYLAEV
jgi:hypothetical protein